MEDVRERYVIRSIDMVFLIRKEEVFVGVVYVFVSVVLCTMANVYNDGDTWKMLERDTLFEV